MADRKTTTAASIWNMRLRISDDSWREEGLTGFSPGSIARGTRRACVQAHRAGAEVSNEESAPQHGEVFHEHGLLHPSHHRVLNGPEVVHGDRDRDQKEDQQPCPDPGPVSG